MAEVTIHANAIDTAGWNSPSGTAADIDEAIASADGNLYSAGADSTGQLILGLGAHGLSDSDTITNVSITVRVSDSGDAGTRRMGVDLLIGGSAQGTTQSTGDLTSTLSDEGPLNDAGWNSDWTESQLDGMQVGLTPSQAGMPGTNLPAVDCIDVVITYTEAATDDVDFAGTNPSGWGAFVMPKALSTYIPYGMRMAPEAVEGGYHAIAVSFAGTEVVDYGDIAAQLSDSKTGTLSVWLNVPTWPSGAFEALWATTTAAGLGRVVFQLQTTSGAMLFFARDSAGTTRVNLTIASLPVNAWFHLLISWDTATASGWSVYVDDADHSANVTETTFTDGALEWTQTDSAIGAFGPSLTNKLNAYVADLWIDVANRIDITSVANRRKFIDSGGKPVDLSSDGSGPTGAQVEFTHNKSVSNWQTNAGSITGGTEIGTLTAAPNSPSD